MFRSPLCYPPSPVQPDCNHLMILVAVGCCCAVGGGAGAKGPERRASHGERGKVNGTNKKRIYTCLVDNLFMCFPNENLLLCDDECKLLSRDKIVASYVSASTQAKEITSKFCSAAIQFNKLQIRQYSIILCEFSWKIYTRRRGRPVNMELVDWMDPN